MSSFTWDCACGARNAASAAACPECGRTPADPSTEPRRPVAAPEPDEAPTRARSLPFSASGTTAGETRAPSGFGQVPNGRRSARPHPLLGSEPPPSGLWPPTTGEARQPGLLAPVPEARLTGVDFHRGPSGASGVDFDHGSGSSVDFDHGSAAPQVEPWLSVVPPASSLSLVPPLPGNGTLLDLPPNGAPPPLSPDLDPDGRTATVPPAEAAEPPQPAEEPAGEGKAPKPPRVRRHRRLRLTPGLVVVVLFLIACLVVVGEVVAKSGNDKPPSPSQVSSVAP